MGGADRRPCTHLRKILDDSTPAPFWPVGSRLARFRADRHAREAHALLSAGYRCGGGHLDPFDLWWAALRDDPEYDPKVFFLALDPGGRVIGAAQCWTSGFLKDLGVALRWRRRGLGEALLLHAFGAFRRQGAAHFDLKVERDNPSGAERLYRRLGMRPVV